MERRTGEEGLRGQILLWEAVVGTGLGGEGGYWMRWRLTARGLVGFRGPPLKSIVGTHTQL